jgi:glycogen(starch) synthase
MRVLVLTNMYPPHHYGGYELNCMEFVDAMRAAGHDVLVLTSDHHVAGATDDHLDRTRTRRDLRLYWRDQRVTKPSIRDCLEIERSNQRALLAALDDHRPDVVSAWHLGAMSMGLVATTLRRRLPVVAVVNDDWLVYGPLVDGWLARTRRLGPLSGLAERVVGVPCRAARLGSESAVVLISGTTRDNALRSAWWQGARSTVGYCGVNLDDFPLVARSNAPAWGWRLLHVGRVDERKGIDTCIRALADLPPRATLEVVGRGDDAYRDELQALAARLGVVERVAFTVATRDELREHYDRADVVLFAPRWEEPFGLVPLEAMARSTPVVATGTGGSGEFLIDASNCLRVAVDDAAGVAAGVRRLARDPALRARLVSGGAVTAAHLSLARWLGLLERWHQAASDRFSGGQPPDREPIAEVLDGALAPRSGPA